MTATTALGSDVASVSWVEPTVIDNSGVMISAGSNKRPGDEFGIGSTTVTYVALDDEGNSGRCEFEVIVTGEFRLFSFEYLAKTVSNLHLLYYLYFSRVREIVNIVRLTILKG